MKLYAIINGQRYEICEGSTFAEEYNETLDSGSIILDQIPRIEGLKPFDDVFIYNETTESYPTVALGRTLEAKKIKITKNTLDGMSNLVFMVGNSPYEFVSITPIGVIGYNIVFRKALVHTQTIRFTKSVSSGVISWISEDIPSSIGATVTVRTPATWAIDVDPFYKHMLIDDYSEELNNVISKTAGTTTYKYKIGLFSETKRLDKIILPNISITQPLRKSERRSVYSYLGAYLDLYSPKIKVVDNAANHTWKYVNKYKLATRVQTLFEKVDAPEMSLSQPTLRDIISRLMVVKDCIPVVHDDEIDYLDITQRNGTFSTDPNYVSFIHGTMSSANYSLEARREYSGAISQENSARMVEYLGFRNSNTALLTIENLVLETRFPIYKINKIKMCYYKYITLRNKLDGTRVSKYLLFKQDITDLVCQNIVRNSLSTDYVTFNNWIQSSAEKTVDELREYRMATVGYDIGSNTITGWGEKYTFLPSPGIFRQTNTTLQNIINFMDRYYPFGCESYDPGENWSVLFIGQPLSGDEGIDKIETGGVYTGSAKQKAVLFEIDYNAMFGGAIVHSKDNTLDDDLVTADNCSSSLTIVESDGLFEKEKMNRFANKTYNIQARYSGINAYHTMETTCNHILGSVYKDGQDIDDVIIYHREYSIYNNFILSNFSGTFDYVLKNYFTTVFAKLRTYNLASYGESIVRSENRHEYAIMSSDESYYESGTLLYGNLERFMTMFTDTKTTSAMNIFDETNKVNFAYVQGKVEGDATDIIKSRAFSDVNTFCSGYSLCVNLQMYDNVTHGAYISSAMYTDGGVEDTVIGSVQEWNIVVDSVRDPFQEKMSFGFGHMYQIGDTIPSGKTVFLPREIQTSWDLAFGYNTDILTLPGIYQKDEYDGSPYTPRDYLSESTSYYIGVSNSIYKDNKEIINYTFQFDPYSIDKNVFFSQWFSKLSDMSGSYKKWYNSLVRSKAMSSSSAIGSFYWDNDVTGQADYSLNIARERFLSMTADSWYNVKGVTTVDVSHPEEIDAILVTPPFTDEGVLYTDTFYLRLYAVRKNTEGNPDIKFIYKQKKVRNSDGVIFWSDHEKVFSTLVTQEGPNNDYVLRTAVKLRDDDEGQEFPIYIRESSTLTQNREVKMSADFNVNTTEIHVKNMFAIISTKEIKKEIVYDSYASEEDNNSISGVGFPDLPNDMLIINTDNPNGSNYIPFNQIFSYTRVGNKPAIHVGNAGLSNYPRHKSIQFWYLDNKGSEKNDMKLQFVFGVNTQSNEKNVFVSSLLKKSQTVFSTNHKNKVGHIKNQINDTFVEQNIYEEDE